MKLIIEIETSDASTFSDAYRVLNAFKDKAGNATAAAPTSAPSTPATASPAPAPSPTPAAPTPAAASSPAPAAPAPAPSPAPAPAAAPAPAPASAPAPAPAAAAPAPAPAPAAGGVTQAALGAMVQAYAKAYTPKGCKARFTQLAEAFQQPSWTSINNIPADQYEAVAPWFAVEA